MDRPPATRSREFNRTVQLDKRLLLDAPGGLIDQPTAVFTKSGVHDTDERWMLRAKACSLIGTTLRVRRRGAFAPGDIETGIEHFDRGYHVTGSDVRGLLQSAEVRDASTVRGST